MIETVDKLLSATVIPVDLLLDPSIYFQVYTSNDDISRNHRRDLDTKLAADSLKEGFVNLRSRVQIVPMASLVANDGRTQKRSS